MRKFEIRIREWLLACFGFKIARDKKERSFRFIEEAIELVQATGITKEEVQKLTDYVYGRPIGVIEQEIGGVMVTLAALCYAQDIDLGLAAQSEATRIEGKIDVIRAKQVSKDLAMVTSEESRGTIS